MVSHVRVSRNQEEIKAVRIPAGEADLWKTEKDPIRRFSARVVDEGLIDAGDLRRIEAEVEAELESAVEEAENAPLPDVSALYEDVYSQE